MKNDKYMHIWWVTIVCSIFHSPGEKAAHTVWSDKTVYLPRLPLTRIQIPQQSKVAVREFITVLFLQTLAINWIDGGEVAAVHRTPSLRFRQNQRHQLWSTICTQSTSVSQHIFIEHMILCCREIHWFMILLQQGVISILLTERMCERHFFISIPLNISFQIADMPKANTSFILWGERCSKRSFCLCTLQTLMCSNV